MPFPKKTVIAVDTSLKLEILNPIQRLDFLAQSEIHLVHVVRMFDYGDALSPNITFPLPDEMDPITEAITSKMKRHAQEFLPYWHQGEVKYECLFSFNPEEELCHYVNHVKADLVIITSRSERGFLESSFSETVAIHSKTNVLVL